MKAEHINIINPIFIVIDKQRSTFVSNFPKYCCFMTMRFLTFGVNILSLSPNELNYAI